MSNSCGGGKFALGIVLGAVVGAVATYFSDKQKRERFSEDFSTGVDRARDSIVEGYYEAKQKYQEYRDRLKGETEALLNDAQDELADL